jgi:hypothetical protein
MKRQTHTKRLLSILLSFALVVTLFAGLGITASATSTWDGTYPAVDLTSTFSGGTGTQANPYLISVAQDFAQLAVNVNSGSTSTTAYSGQYFLLTDDIDLANYPWTPIGGASPMSGGTPTGSYFGGTFSGYDTTNRATYFTHTISNLNITASSTAANNSGYGLFGYVNGGVIEHLSIDDGEVDMSDNPISIVGGIVGYTNGTLYNLHNLGTIVNVQNTSASQAGGVAGTVENINAGSTIYVLYCSNEASVTGRGRVGGIVGAVYNASAVGTVVDLCFNRNNKLITVGTTQKSYTGGIVGYNRGYIADSYSYNASLSTSGGHYIAGLVGIIQGTAPVVGALYNSYAYSVFNGSNANYDRFIFASADSSNTMTINNSLWVDTNTQPDGVTITQPTATGSNGWGNWTQVGYVQRSDPTTANVYTTPSTTSTTAGTLTVLNAQGSFTLADGNAYAVGGKVFNIDGTTNNGYPYLLWEQDPGMIPPTPPGTTPVAPTDYDPADGPTGAIFLDGTAPAGGTGTKANPFNTFAAAAAAAQSWTGINAIYVRGLVTVSATDTWTLPATFTVYRSSIYDGYLFDVDGGATLTLNAITIDGNSSYVTHNFPSGSLALFEVTNGSVLNVGANVILQNNTSRVGGGAIDAVSGTVNITGGTILNNTGADGGALHVEASSTATMSGGILENNTAYHGGAVYVEYGGTFTLSGNATTGGTISNNTANNSGGGVDTRGTFNMTGGTISGNTSADGGGVAVLATGTGSPGVFTMSGGAITGNVVKSTVSTAHGGGVYVAIGGVFNLNGGTISNNATTGDGAGIYADWTTGDTYPIVINSTGSSNVITVSDIIYLNGPATTTGDEGAEIKISAAPATGTATLKIQVANPGAERVVAEAVDGTMATSSLPFFQTWQNAPMTTGTGSTANEIWYNNATLLSE